MKLLIYIAIFFGLLFCGLITAIFYYHHKETLSSQDFMSLLTVLMSTGISSFAIILIFIIQHDNKIKTDRAKKLNEIEKFQALLFIYSSSIQLIYEEINKKENKNDVIIFDNFDLSVKDFVSLNELIELKIPKKLRSNYIYDLYTYINMMMSSSQKLRFLASNYNELIRNKEEVPSSIRGYIIIEIKFLFISLFFIHDSYLNLLLYKYKRKYVYNIRKESAYQEGKVLFFLFLKDISRMLEG